ncbi:4-amino-4-deoxy-L-arabinose transferase-like glycosyltransferase [Kitasatospora sp. MAP12-15]|uniref:ArnT family glycosyltransferase n=1 Tax=unclassified Kitasatospora TaxID=2633591 RepID=UPI0024760DE1|nr:glycosyltransferase family 39 protein [Kitasatospora sp. MAP12-44]MDH6111787.1 4-amino-4-deoxy-L-arabinose transferase-like glycosyltransferase [Kitasatospora sp. MAP12-44]
MATSTLLSAPELPSVPQSARRAPWRSPAGQPAYARPVLLGIAALAGVLYFWGIGQSTYHVFYADGVRSMTESWKAFVFGSYDPASTITLDKLPGFLWPQALSARLLGFHPWALTLPQAVEGVLSVLVLFRAVRRWAGAEAALLAAGAFALTPVVAGLFRTAVEDPAFTLLLLLAADAAQRAARRGRLRSLLLAGVWVGLAFQTKMLEAWAVLPVFGAVYLIAAPVRLRRRLGHLALAGLVTLAVSASWVGLMTLTPAGDRPYIDGTTDNSAYSMVVGYNFLNRFSAVGLNAGQTGSVVASRTGGGPGGHQGAGPAQGQPQGQNHAGGSGSGGPMGGDGGWTKMFSSQFAPQTGWLYPLAAISLCCALLWRRRAPRTDPLRAGYLLWGGWLAVFFVVFSAGSVGGHSYYMGVIAVPLAALSGAGIVLLRQAYLDGGRRAWALPAAVVGTVAWSAYLAQRFPAFLPWLAPTALGTGGLALLLLGAAKTERFGGGGVRGLRIAAAGLVAAVAAVLVGPAAWAASVLDPAYGNSGMGTVGPQAQHGFGRPQPSGAAQPGDAAWAAALQGHSTLSAAQRALLGYVRAHDEGARYLFATTTWTASSPYILATGAEVLPIGGFTGQAPAPTLDRLRSLVAGGQLHYVLIAPGLGERLTGAKGGGQPPAETGPTEAITSWVRADCTPVPPAEYTGPAEPERDQTLYRCAP